MPTKFAKGDEVRVLADKFDGTGEKDELGKTWSERWLHDGNGEWCCGKITFVFQKKRNKPQKYRIKYHEGTSMESDEGDIEMTPQEEERAESSSVEREEREQLHVGDRDDEDEDDRHPLEREAEDVDGNTGTVELESEEDEPYEEDETVTVGGTVYRVREVKRQRTTNEDKDSDDEGDERDIKMGETVTAGEYRWERIEGILEDARTEPHFDTTFKTNLFNDAALEIDIFRALMPLDRDQLFTIVRENADEDEDRRVRLGWHVDATVLAVQGHVWDLQRECEKQTSPLKENRHHYSGISG